MMKGLLILVGLLLLIVIASHAPGEKPRPVQAVTWDTEPKKQQILIDPTTKAKVAEIKDSRFCIEYGKAVRAKTRKSEPDFLPAMVERAIADFSAKDAFVQDIAARRVALGMNWCEVYAAFGLPNVVNRSVGLYGEHIQFVYRDSGRYVYTENGIVTSWQD